MGGGQSGYRRRPGVGNHRRTVASCVAAAPADIRSSALGVAPQLPPLSTLGIAGDGRLGAKRVLCCFLSVRQPVVMRSLHWRNATTITGLLFDDDAFIYQTSPVETRRPTRCLRLFHLDFIS